MGIRELSALMIQVRTTCLCVCGYGGGVECICVCVCVCVCVEGGGGGGQLCECKGVVFQCVSVSLCMIKYVYYSIIMLLIFV